jgi:hypothetical protein
VQILVPIVKNNDETALTEEKQQMKKDSPNEKRPIPEW